MAIKGLRIVRVKGTMVLRALCSAWAVAACALATIGALILHWWQWEQSVDYAHSTYRYAYCPPDVRLGDLIAVVGLAVASHAVPWVWRGQGAKRIQQQRRVEVVLLDPVSYRQPPARHEVVANEASLERVREVLLKRRVAWGVALGVAIAMVGLNRGWVPFHVCRDLLDFLAYLIFACVVVASHLVVAACAVSRWKS